MSLSTHVLDSAKGRPAPGVAVRLERRGDDGWSVVAAAATDDDGRVREFTPDGPEEGVYRLVFDTSAHSPFYPEVCVTFRITEPSEHHHVPLLLSPYAYSTYRGS